MECSEIVRRRMLLTAVDEGLGACFFGIQPDQQAGFRSELGGRRRGVDAVVHRGQLRA